MKKIIGLVILCCFFVTGCDNKDAYVPYEKAKDMVTVTLEENASTGYVWGFTIEDTNVLEYKNDEVLADTKAMNGGVGIHEFTFAGKAEGKTTILFLNKRDWEQGEEPAMKRVIQVSVDANLNIKEIVELENK